MVYVIVNILALIFWLLYVSYCRLSGEQSRMWNLIQIFASMLCKWHGHIKVDLFAENLSLISNVVLIFSYGLHYINYSMVFNRNSMSKWIKLLGSCWTRHMCKHNFSFGAGEADPEAIYNLCLILKKVCCECHAIGITVIHHSLQLPLYIYK